MAGLAFISPVEATIYRVGPTVAADIEAGADNRSLTLRQLATARLDSGDVIELPCGAVLREPLVLPPNLPAGLTVRAEPGCSAAQRPTLKLTNPVNGWRAAGAGIYIADIDYAAQQVFVDGIRLAPASFPVGASSIAQEGDSADAGRSGSRWLADEAIESLSGRSLDGAQVHLRTTPWSIEARTVVRQEAGRLFFDSPTRFPVRKNVRYTLSGKPWMLEQGPGWAWERSEHRLYVRLPDGSHPGKRVEATRFDTGLLATGANKLSVSGLRIFGSGGDGLRCAKCQQVELGDIEILDAGRDGVGLEEASDLRISGLLIQRAARDGLNLLRSQRGEVFENRLEDIGNGGWPQSSRAAINAGSTSELNIHHNCIQQAGYNGINFGRLSRVANNALAHICLALDDCGAIYSWANTDPRPLNSEVNGNIIENVVGNRTRSPESWTLAAGIYLDDLTNGVRVTGNVVNKAERGVMLHNAFDNVVQNNILFGSRTNALVIGTDHSRFPSTMMTINHIYENQFVVAENKPLIYILNRNARNVQDDLDMNIYVAPKLDTAFINHRRTIGSDSVEKLSFKQIAGRGIEKNGRQVLLGGNTSLLLVNDDALIKRVGCPSKSVNQCELFTDLEGQRVIWPVVLSGWSGQVFQVQPVP
jgi:parallel beta-helix repeat protein